MIKLLKDSFATDLSQFTNLLWKPTNLIESNISRIFHWHVVDQGVHLTRQVPVKRQSKNNNDKNNKKELFNTP